jgi:glycosyltransferase involved in cell wall biosynthesis
LANTDAAPLRICYLISHFHPHASGAERQALAQGRELVRRGHQVRVVTRHVPGYPDDEVLEGVKVHRWVRTIQAGPLFGVSFVGGVVGALVRLRSHCDLIHTHQALWESIATGFGRPFLRGTPVLVQPASAGYYGEAEEMARTRGFRFLRKMALRNPYFAAISREIERQWLELGVRPECLARMASGVDAQHFAPGPSRLEAQLPGRPRVVFTGRLHPQKNLGRLLDAWPQVVSQTGAVLVLVGDGPDREALGRQAEALGISPHVHFAGSVEDSADFLRAADAFVLPSVAEGMSNSLLEAMSTGLPCVASEIGGNVDLLGDDGGGPVGWLVPTDATPAQWADALVEALDSTEMTRARAAASRDRVLARYSIEAVVDRYLELYARILAGAPIGDL